VLWLCCCRDDYREGQRRQLAELQHPSHAKCFVLVLLMQGRLQGG
jgi:hypothetical protein